MKGLDLGTDAGAARVLLASAVALAVLVAFPGIDLFVSGWFYVAGAGFPLADLPLFRFVMRALSDLAVGGAVLASIVAVFGFVRGRVWWGATPRRALFLALSLALGPGLIVNTLLKDHWGRARPHQILEFGGSAHFSPAVLIADQCARNCSFPSGHGALGFWLVAYAMLCTPAWRGPVMGAALATGALVGLMRIAQGAHFLSDVVAAAVIAIGFNLALKRALRPDTTY